MERQTGILLAISSLPGNQGIGDFGKPAYRFIDMLAKHHITLWQILPLHPLGYGNSPYQPFSTYAGDSIYINIDHLADLGLLKQSSIRNYNKFSEHVEYGEVRKFKEPYLRKAYRNFKKNFYEYEASYLAFEESAHWLSTYACFAMLKRRNHLSCWIEWPKEDKEWLQETHDDRDGGDEIAYEKFLQFLFYMQWDDVKAYANRKGIKIVGDMPFYVGLDSADVWEHRQDFLLERNGRPSFVAGVPPDYFAKEGQRWGNPIYNWKRMKKDHYDFWIHRLAWAHEHFDYTRIDHFRAFDTYWMIPAEQDTAKVGEWIEGPSYDFFNTILQVIPDIKIIAEDLGELRDEVHELRDAYAFYGMRVLQFEMEPKLLKKGLPKHCILYPGTHDNDTLEQWYEKQTMNMKIALRRFFHNRNYVERDFHDLVCHYALRSEADVCILSMQDVLGLKEEGRMNVPSTIGSPNWEWKLKNLKEVETEMNKIDAWMKEGKRVNGEV